jgi:hypothetical protein
LAIEEKPNLGSLGRRLAFVRLLLNERTERLRGRPHRLFNAAVDDRSLAVGETTNAQLGNLRNLLGCRERRPPGTERTDSENNLEEPPLLDRHDYHATSVSIAQRRYRAAHL